MKLRKIFKVLFVALFLITTSFSINASTSSATGNLVSTDSTASIEKCTMSVDDYKLKPGESITVVLDKDCLLTTVEGKSITAQAGISVSIKNTGVKIQSSNFWMYVYKVTGDGLYHFCVEPNTPYGSGGYSKITDIKAFLRRKYSATVVDNVMHAGLHGTRAVKLSTSTAAKDQQYIATQAVITGYLRGQNMSTSNSSINSKISALKTKVNNHRKIPSFHNKTYTVKGGTTVSFTDTTKQFRDFTIENATAFKTATGMSVTKSGDVIKVSNPATNIKTSTASVSSQKYKGWFPTGSGFALSSSTYQDYGTFAYGDPVYSVIKFKAQSIVGHASFMKKLDGIDLYSDNIKDVDGNLVYNTSDGKFKYVEENGIVTSVNYPSEKEFNEQNLYNTNISYDSPILVPQMIEQNKIDPDTQLPIQAKNEDGSLKVDENGDPVWETEQVQRKTPDGQLMYICEKDQDGKVKTQKVELTQKYPEENGMKLIKPGAAKFEVRNASNNALVTTLTTNATTGLGTISNLQPGSYYLVEIEAQEGYKKSNTRYNFTIVTGQTTKINAGKDIYNYALAGELNVTKIDKDFKDRLLNGAGFELYLENEDGTYDETSPIAYFETHDGGLASLIKEPGKYVFKEIKAPDGYVVDPTEHRVEIKLDGTELVTFENEQIKNDFSFKKVASHDINLRLNGGKFVVYSRDAKGNIKAIETFSANKNQEFTFKAFHDMYEIAFVEIEAPGGYVLDKDKPIHWYRITEDGIQNDITMKNDAEEIIFMGKTGGFEFSDLFNDFSFNDLIPRFN